MNPSKKTARLNDTKALQDTPYKMPPSDFERKMPDLRSESNPVVACTHETMPMPSPKK